MSLPDPAPLKANPGAAYLHMISNETIGGVQWGDFPDTGDVPWSAMPRARCFALWSWLLAIGIELLLGPVIFQQVYFQ